MPNERRPLTRSEIMGRIGPRDTKPEMIVRRGLHRLGYRYRLHEKNLPGKPDLVLPKYKAVIFVHGCFWHAHLGCAHFKIPKSRQAFWHEKLSANRQRDKHASDALLAAGWRVLTVWECATRTTSAIALAESIADWLQGEEISGDMAGAAMRL